ncbi:hypothetical protein F511_06387 [Dorcoceras hygrometricum]|uniref:Uncharacterized protein n=1 Tax=Dorcoceras hygrometricum TaxID=472368 RepID=A0A2Z7ACN8_9LAMI|nr:hypothetical protein F511_06387 [Dorcoceras hygrometricum]
MGNYVSCTFLSPKLGTHKAARVLLPGGEIRQFQEVVKAAELMLETPGFFVVNAKSLCVGRRFSPLTADEDLEFANLYFMFPLRRANSVVTAADVAVFLMAANSAPKRIAGRISPETIEEAAVDDCCESGRARLCLDGVIPDYKYRAASCRSRKPLLDTISEEPVSSR